MPSMQNKTTSERLQELKSLYDANLITQEDFEAKLKQISEEAEKQYILRQKIKKFCIIISIIVAGCVGMSLIYKAIKPSNQFVAQKAVIEAEIAAVERCQSTTDIYSMVYFYNTLNNHEKNRREFAKKYLDNRPGYYRSINADANNVKAILQKNEELRNRNCYTLLNTYWNDYFCIPEPNKERRKPDTISEKERVVINELNGRLANKINAKFKELNGYIYDYEVYYTYNMSSAVKYNNAYLNKLINTVNNIKYCSDFDAFYTQLMIHNDLSSYLSQDDRMYGSVRTASNGIEEDIIYQATESWGDYITSYIKSNNKCLFGSWQIRTNGGTSYIDLKQSVIKGLSRTKYSAVTGFKITKNKFEIEVYLDKNDYQPITGIGRNIKLLIDIVDYFETDSLFVTDRYGKTYRMTGDLLDGAFTLNDKYFGKMNKILKQGGDVQFDIYGGPKFIINADFYENALANIGAEVNPNKDESIEYVAIQEYKNKAATVRDYVLRKNPSQLNQNYKEKTVRYRILKECPDETRHALYYAVDSVCVQCSNKGKNTMSSVWLVRHDLKTDKETMYKIYGYVHGYEVYGDKNGLIFVRNNGESITGIDVFSFNDNELKEYHPPFPVHSNMTQVIDEVVDDIRRTITFNRKEWIAHAYTGDDDCFYSTLTISFDDIVKGTKKTSVSKEETHSSVVNSGVFSISENKKVKFSKGNLQYQASTKKWRFADNQWDIIGLDNEEISSGNSGWIDLFGWGTANNPTITTNDDKTYVDFNDWGNNTISNDNNQGWFTLSVSEWIYLLDTRNTASKIKYAKAIVNGVKGLILLPDNWDASYYNLNNTNNTYATFESNTISQSDWKNKLEKNGVIFLPLAGCRREKTVSDVDGVGYYWTSTPSSSISAFCVLFGDRKRLSGLIYIDKYMYYTNEDYYRGYGLSVRLVREVKK